MLVVKDTVGKTHFPWKQVHGHVQVPVSLS